MINLRMRWTKDVAQMARRKMRGELRLESQEERHH
jgi:hypothetical protein